MSLAHLTGLVALVLLALAGVALLLAPAIRRTRRPAPRRLAWRCRRPLACGDPNSCDCTQDTREGPSYFARRAHELPRTIETGGGPALTFAPPAPPTHAGTAEAPWTCRWCGELGPWADPCRGSLGSQWARRDAQARLDEAQREHEAERAREEVPPLLVLDPAAAERLISSGADELRRALLNPEFAARARIALGLSPEAQKVDGPPPRPSHRYGWPVVLVGETWYAVPDPIQGAPLAAVVVERHDAGQLAWIREHDEAVRARAFEAAGVA